MNGLSEDKALVLHLNSVAGKCMPALQLNVDF